METIARKRHRWARAITAAELGRAIVTLRTAWHLTQAELESALGLRPGRLSRYERGHRMPDLGTTSQLFAEHGDHGDHGHESAGAAARTRSGEEDGTQS